MDDENRQIIIDQLSELAGYPIDKYKSKKDYNKALLKMAKESNIGQTVNFEPVK